MARFVLQEDIEQILKEVSLNFPLMIFLFMPDNLVAHSSIKRSVSPFFLIMSVLSHQPQVCHLCCCLHRGGMYPDHFSEVRKHGVCKLPVKYKNKHFHYENGQALEHLAKEVVLCTQPGDTQNFRLSAT